MSNMPEILATRAVVRPGSYAVIPAAGLVNNVIPGVEKCRVSIVASPKIGASFVQYVAEAEAGGGTSRPFAAEAGVESFLYCVEGEGTWAAAGDAGTLKPGAYAFAPAGAGLEFRNTAEGKLKLLLYKQRYLPLAGHAARLISGDADAIPFRVYEGLPQVLIKDLLPAEIGFDLNFHILSFLPGGGHPFVETHVQEHGAYVLSGAGCYYLNDNWSMIKKDDFVWFGPFCPQAAYGVGQEEFTYIYSKDCHRDAAL
ncbi:MAG: cupin domain-containing protein [Gracilibacteraceae bacterium]|jgi:(S)-ureidoglycine aminohydrolase|nr:cupin domain-containing protein [Gracilibacteraceae bacterium]